MILLLVIIILPLLTLYIERIFTPKEQQKNEEINNNIDMSKYISNGYIMTQTELKFYRELKKVTDKMELAIFPQIDLERLINVKDNNNRDRNRIKSRSIDFSIVNNKNCKIVCCIELDDYTHNRENVKKVDSFKNNLFKQVNIPLYRIKVNNYYDLDNIEIIIKESLKLPTI